MQQSMYHQPPPVYHQNAAAGNALFPLATTADAPSRIPAAEPKLRKSYRPKMSCHQCRFRKVKVCFYYLIAPHLAGSSSKRGLRSLTCSF